jgi:hypothetical protein
MDNNSCKNLTDLIDLRQAAELLPRRASGQPISTACLKKWMLHGLHGERLEYAKVGSRYFTTQGWIERFVLNLTDADRRAKIAENWQSCSEPIQINEARQARTIEKARELGLLKSPK